LKRFAVRLPGLTRVDLRALDFKTGRAATEDFAHEILRFAVHGQNVALTISILVVPPPVGLAAGIEK
jgi:hypothetical protein